MIANLAMSKERLTRVARAAKKKKKKNEGGDVLSKKIRVLAIKMAERASKANTQIVVTTKNFRVRASFSPFWVKSNTSLTKLPPKKPKKNAVIMQYHAKIHLYTRDTAST